MLSKLELMLLGNPELYLAGQPLARFRSAKAYALFYYLVVTRRAQPRTALAGLFWGDVDEYYARRNLNRTLSNLTQLVGNHLEITRQSVAFARDQPYWLDVEVLDDAATMPPTGQNVAVLAAAADRYRGDFLDGFYVHDAPEFEQWVLTERTRLRASALQLHHELSDYYAQQGALPQAMEHARRILQLEPWREEAHRQLMKLLAQSGQRSAALTQFELCRQALASELNVEPDAATLALVAQIRAGEFAPPAAAKPAVQSDPVTLHLAAPVTSSPRHNLPIQSTSFVGRETELAEITRLLLAEADCRLLTLVGPGGMGKTRLALQATEQTVSAAAKHGQFADGCFFIPLENVSETIGVCSAIVSVIAKESGFALRSDAPLQDQLVRFLSDRSMLLVLDNFEHLVKQAGVLSGLLAAAPNIKLLVTSRVSLNLQEAWFYPLLGLTIPNELPEHAAQDEYDAVQLFAQCARRARPNFVLAAERAVVVQICMLLEGMPLAIEMAAAWLKVMTCKQIAQEVARGLDFLTTRTQNIPARHRSMRAVMDYSWTLLSEEEREAIVHLAIFRGKFRQDAALTVTGASLLTLAALVEKALVRATPDGYFQLHELTRQYAEEKLTSAASSALCDAHAIYYAGLLDQQKPRLFTDAYRQVWLTVSGEFDNIRHAWQWSVDAAGAGRDDLPVATLLRQMVEVLTYYHLFHSLWLPGLALFDHACQVLEAAGWASSNDNAGAQFAQRVALVQIQISTGQLHLEMGHHRTSLAVAERALAGCRAFGLEEDLVRALLVYGYTQTRRGAHAEGVPALQEALALAGRLRSPRYSAEAMIGLGLIASNEGRYLDAQSHFRQALALCQEMGYRPWVARTLTNLGTTFSRQYAYQQAQPYYEQALAIAEEEGNQTFIMINVSNLGGVHRGFGRYPLSIDHYQRSLAMARSLGEERWIAANLNGLAITYLEMGELTAAERALREALIVGQQSDSTPDILGSIGLLGHVFARRGQLEDALKLLAFAERHPSIMARDRLYHQPLLAELHSELEPALFEWAAAWAAGQTLDEVIHWLLYSASGTPVDAFSLSSATQSDRTVQR